MFNCKRDTKTYKLWHIFVRKRLFSKIDLLEIMDISVLKEMSIQYGNAFRIELFPEDGVTPKNQEDTSPYKNFVVLGVDQELI